MTAQLLMLTFRLWLLELPITAVNWFVLAHRVYEPRVGPLRAHQIAMTTRIVYVVVLAYVLLRWAATFTALDTLYAGFFWMLLWLAFEWGGSALLRRPVREVLIGWHVTQGYLWPWVLVTYLLSPLIVGLLVHSTT